MTLTRLAVFAAFVALCAASSSVVAGRSSACHMGTLYNVDHNVVLASNTSFVDVDSFPGIRSMSCNSEESDIMLKFASASDAAAFVDAVVSDAPQHTFITSEFKTCSSLMNTLHPVRRVISAVATDASVEVRAVASSYSELIQEGTVSIASAGSCDALQHFCVGYNVDAQCSGAANVMPLYSNKFVNLACSSCYAAFQGDVFITLDIKRFKLQVISLVYKPYTPNPKP